jgi:hypothetical protein
MLRVPVHSNPMLFPSVWYCSLLAALCESFATFAVKHMKTANASVEGFG